MAKIDYNVLTRLTARSQKTADLAFIAAKDQVDKEIRDLKNKFENDDVTQEIQGGEFADSKSGVTGGYGNLFSFIGFTKGTDPISPIRAALEKFQLIKTRKTPIVRGRVIKYNFTLKTPTEEIRKVSQMEWQPGSWVAGIKRGISGIGNYLAKEFGDISRSGGGIQTKTSRARQFNKRDYLFEWINQMLSRLKGD